MLQRVDVAVTAKIDIEGKMTPIELETAEGISITIDKILCYYLRKASVGGSGPCWMCRMRGQERMLFL